ncbi:MAG TPA: TonB-dependent receptor [Bordetella sp.]
MSVSPVSAQVSAEPSLRARPTPLALAVHAAFATALALGFIQCSQAQTPAQAAQYDVPAGPLAEAVNRFAQQSGVSIVMDANQIRGLTSPGLRGNYGVQEGFDMLLRGSGYTAGKTPAGYVLRPTPPSTSGMRGESPAVMPAVSVVGARPSDELPPAYAGGQVATGGRVGLLGNRDMMDTPFSVVSYTSKTIEDHQAQSIGDALMNDPSVRVDRPAGSYADEVYIRGFPLMNPDIFFNGLSGVLPYNFVGPEFLERVELLRGASGLLYGISPNGAVGGAINVVPKRATDDPITRLTTTYSSDSQFGTHVDVGRRFGEDNRWGIRFNGTFRDGDMSANNTSERLGAGMLGLDYRGDRFRFSLDGGYQNRRLKGFFDSLDFLSNDFKVPSAPKASDNYPSWTRFNSEDTFGMARAEYDIAPDWTVFAAAGFSHNNSSTLGGVGLLENSAGDALFFPRANKFTEDSASTQVGIRGKFDTGPIGHQVSLTGDYYRHRAAFGQTLFASQDVNIYDPGSFSAPDLSSYSPNAPLSSITENSSVAAADTLSILDDRIQLTAGLREQHIDTRNYAATGTVSSEYDRSVLTPAVAFVVKPWERVSLYANYIEGLQPGAVVPATYANGGQALPPYVSRQYEIGTKVDWGKVTTTLSLFQIKQPSGSADPLTNIYSANGEQRNRGIELQAFGEAAQGVRLLGGIALTDARLTQTNSPATQGNRPYGVPDVQANLGVEWDTPFVQNLTLTGNAVYTSSQYIDATNQQKIPSWIRFDVGARYVWQRENGKPITFRAQILNVTNRRYWSSYSFTNSLAEGAPRTVMLSAQFDF